MKKDAFLKRAVALTLAVSMFSSAIPAFAATDDDIDAQILEQQKKLDELNAQRSLRRNAELERQIDTLQVQLSDLRSQNRYDAEGAIDALAVQIDALRQQIEEQDARQAQLMDAIERLERLAEKKTESSSPEPQGDYITPEDVPDYVVPNESPSYIQNAASAQGKSTMVFSYAPNQIYEIYCRVGYLTDLSLKKGETINFVGGGDTSSWAINSTTVDGVPHLYIKPVVETSSTNIIVTTDKRSYQLLVHTSDWYTPMVQWNYGKEELDEMIKEQEKKNVDTFRSGYDKLNFNYKIEGTSSVKPKMVFDDREKTVIRYEGRMPDHAPAIFVRGRNMRSVSLANFKIKDNCYIIDQTIDEAELRFSDKEIVTIKRKS